MSNSMKVSVQLNKEGKVISVSPNNPAVGWVTVASEQYGYGVNGFLQFGRRMAFIAGEVEKLQAWVSALNLTEGSEIPGKIVVVETLTPLNDKNPLQGIKYAGRRNGVQGPACVVDGQPIYRRSYFTPNVETADTLIAHTNGADIKAFIANNPVVVKAEAPDPAARLAELQAIPANKRTKEQKAEMAELM